MAASATVDFLPQHEKEFALEIAARDPADESTVLAARCLFCVHAQPQQQSVQAWHVFVPVLYQRHHEVQHARDWERYQACSANEKDAFFAKDKTAGPGDASANAGAVGSIATAGDGVVVVKRGRGRPRKNPLVGGAVPAATTDAVVVKEKRPRGRPRKSGATAIQWTDEMAQRLLQLRTETFANWFASESRSMKHDGWKLVTSTLADEFSVVVDSDQCQNKLRLLKTQSEKRSAPLEPSTTAIFVLPSNGNLDATVNAQTIVGQAVSLAAGQARRSSWPQPSETLASAVVEKSANGDASSAVAPVKRGRGRPRRDSYPLARPTATTSIALPPQKKQRVHLENEMSNGNALDARGNNRISRDTNTVLLQLILRATEEQKDALVAQKEATRVQTASIQELLQFLKSRPEI